MGTAKRSERDAYTASTTSRSDRQAALIHSTNLTESFNLRQGRRGTAVLPHTQPCVISSDRIGHVTGASAVSNRRIRTSNARNNRDRGCGSRSGVMRPSSGNELQRYRSLVVMVIVLGVLIRWLAIVGLGFGLAPP